MSLQMDTRARLPGWRVVAGLTLLALFGLAFMIHAIPPYGSYTAAAYGDLWPRRFGLIPHIGAGMVAITVGLVQLWLGVTGRTRALHRLLGRVYLGAVAVGCAAGFYLALTITGDASYWTGLFGLSSAWAITTTVAYLAARWKAIEQHREWMIRSYTVTFAFVWFRLTFVVLQALHMTPKGVEGAVAWGCWAVPLLLVEPALQWGKLRRRARV